MILKQQAVRIAQAFTRWNLWEGGGGGSTVTQIYVSGTTSTSSSPAIVYLPYPEGWSYDNCFVISWMYYNTSYGGFWDVSSNHCFAQLRPAGITFYTDGLSDIRGKQVKILLQKL